MKSKHAGLAFMVLSLLVVAGFVYWETRGAADGRSTVGLPPMTPLSDLKVPSADQLRKMDRLERDMPLLTVSGVKGQRADLSAFGYVPMASHGRRLENDAPESSAANDYRITMAFEGRFRRFCVINGRLFSEGAVMDNGAAILKIESRQVLIGENNNQRWLVVEPLFDASPQS